MDYAAEQLALPLTPEERKQLMNAYLHLAPFPESLAVLQSIQQMGGNLAILSDGSPIMLDSLEALEAGVHDYIHYYNHERIKLGLQGLSPVEYRLRNTA